MESTMRSSASGPIEINWHKRIFRWKTSTPFLLLFFRRQSRKGWSIKTHQNSNLLPGEFGKVRQHFRKSQTFVAPCPVIYLTIGWVASNEEILAEINEFSRAKGSDERVCSLNTVHRRQKITNCQARRRRVRKAEERIFQTFSGTWKGSLLTSNELREKLNQNLIPLRLPVPLFQLELYVPLSWTFILCAMKNLICFKYERKYKLTNVHEATNEAPQWKQAKEKYESWWQNFFLWISAKTFYGRESLTHTKHNMETKPKRNFRQWVKWLMNLTFERKQRKSFLRSLLLLPNRFSVRAIFLHQTIFYIRHYILRHR